MPRRRPPSLPAPSGKQPAGVDPQRDHLFISYAWENAALAEWLYRKLTAAGYLVWCDRFKVFGGDRWPKDIDDAIRTRTFRLIALISRFSLEKPNPTKERQLALALSKERKENDFLIPLNLEGLRPSELGWQLSDITFLDFTRWDRGLIELLTKLEKVSTPRPRAGRGSEIAIATFIPPRVVRDKPETLFTNCLPVTGIPDLVVRYKPDRRLFPAEQAELQLHWAFERSGDDLLAFTRPPAGVVQCRISELGGERWRSAPTVHGIRSSDVIAALIRKSMLVASIARGLERIEREWAAYFPRGLLPKDKLSFQSYTKRKSSLMVIGERRTGRSRTRYHLGVGFRVRHDVEPATPVVQTKIRLAISDPAGTRLDWKAANARRKQIAKGWWNHELVTRQLAIAHFLAGSAGEIIVGTVEGQQVRISATPLVATVTLSVDDAAVKSLGARVDDHLSLDGNVEDAAEPARDDPEYHEDEA